MIIMHVSEALAINATRHPNKLIFACEGREYTYRQFNEEVNRMAHGLLALGYKKGDKIGIFMKNSDHFMLAFLAIVRAGFVAVPINFRLTSTETSYILEQSEAKAVFCDDVFEEIVVGASEKTERTHDIIVQPVATYTGSIDWATVRTDDTSYPRVLVTGADDAEILYTSGTTGYPKGALFDHQTVVNVHISYTLCLTLTSEHRALCIAPLFHSAQLNGMTLTAIYLGMFTVIHRDFNPEAVLADIEKYKLSAFFGVPAMYTALLQVPNKEQYDLSTIDKCMYGAAPMAPALIESAMQLFGTRSFYNFCGMTEAGPGGVFLKPEEHDTKLGAGGKAMFLYNTRVVDEDMNDVAPGEIGEFIMRGATIMKEYYRKPEETQKTFRDGWLMTGDLATIDEDGYITVVDRKKDMIISGGENVYSVEVEQVLNSHPHILEAATIGLPDERWGESVTAVIVAKPNVVIDEQEIIAYCREHIASYKIPRKFLYEDALPRNASGKILKYQLRDEYIKAQVE